MNERILHLRVIRSRIMQAWILRRRNYRTTEGITALQLSLFKDSVGVLTLEKMKRDSHFWGQKMEIFLCWESRCLTWEGDIPGPKNLAPTTPWERSGRTTGESQPLRAEQRTEGQTHSSEAWTSQEVSMRAEQEPRKLRVGQPEQAPEAQGHGAYALDQSPRDSSEHI